MDFVVIMIVLAIVAFVPPFLHWWIFGGKQMSSFQIHDDCPDWFIERVNKELDRVFKERRKKEYPGPRSGI